MRCDFTPFMNKSFQIWDNFFPLLFPKDSENLKRWEQTEWTNVKKKSHEILFTAAIWHPLWAKVSNLRPLLLITFPQGFQKSKKIADWTLWRGGNRPLKGVRNTPTKKILLSKAKFAQKLTFFAWRFYTLY